jgi:hypothetical protein
MLLVAKSIYSICSHQKLFSIFIACRSYVTYRLLFGVTFVSSVMSVHVHCCQLWSVSHVAANCGQCRISPHVVFIIACQHKRMVAWLVIRHYAWYCTVILELPVYVLVFGVACHPMPC